MNQLINTIVNGSSQIPETPVVIAAALVIVTVNSKANDKAKAKTGRIAAHTMADIGFEPGAITWMPCA